MISLVLLVSEKSSEARKRWVWPWRQSTPAVCVAAASGRMDGLMATLESVE